MTILAINSGSSSLKFAVIDPVSEAEVATGLADGLGTGNSIFRWIQDGALTESILERDDHGCAIQAMISTLSEKSLLADIHGVGHRVAHGGEYFSASVLITPDVLRAIEKCSFLAPLHNPSNLLGINLAVQQFPDLPNVAVFDTAFHQSMPREAFLYAVPYEWYQDYTIRRYGFHGSSHSYVFTKAAEILGKRPEELNLISAHLGNGCSAAAVRAGKSVDTTMGLTPLEGLVMGTRSGDVDPSLHGFLQDQLGMDLKTITNILNKESGLLGLSGKYSDMRAICTAVAEGDERSIIALEVFVYRLAKQICALTVGLPTFDALVFTGGIGENSSEVRRLVLKHLAVFDLDCDHERNNRNGVDSHGMISSDSSAVAVMVVPTNEELVIARDTDVIIKASKTYECE
jgi:acetate kinase